MSGAAPGRREVAYRIFAAEFDDAELSYSESDEERAPNYVVTPSGARINRLFAVGVLTAVEDVNPEMVRGRLVDPTGAFVTYAGQYQPEALAALERADPPAFFALSGKARTFEPDDGDRIYSSVRPESVNEVDADTRDRWVVTTAERTLERVGVAAAAIESGLAGDQLRSALLEAGVDDRLADGVALALDYYGTTPAYLAELKDTAIDAVRVVAGELDEVGQLELAPDEGGGDPGTLATLDLSGAPSPASAAAAADLAGGGSEVDSDVEPDVEASVDSDADRSEADASVESVAEASHTGHDDVEPDSEIETVDEADTETAVASESPSEPESTPASEPAADSETGGVEKSAAEQEEPSEPPTMSDSEPAANVEDEASENDLDDFDPGEFKLDEAERKAVEDEYGTEFSTADEVEPTAGDSPETDEAVEGESSVEPTDADADDVDLDDAVMNVMKRLDDGEGADREKLIETLLGEFDADAELVEEAIQDALMSGQCYEPSDGTLKPI